MQTLFYIKDSPENKISLWLIALFLIALPFDRFYSEVFFICLVFHSIFHFKKKSLQAIPLTKVLLLQSVFILTLITTTYTPNFSQAIFEWEKQLAIFLFPLVLSTINIDIKKYKNQFLLLFALSCTATTIYLEIDALRIIQYNKLSYSNLLSDLFINANFSAPIALHPTILAMYAVLSISCFFYFMFSNSTVPTKLVFSFCILLLVISLLQLGSKSALLAFLMITISSPFFLSSNVHRKKVAVFSMLLLLIISVGINASGTLKNRFLSTFKNDISNVEVGKSKDEYRIVRWQAALHLTKASPLFGYGAGSEVMILKEEYFKRRLYNSYINQLNAHSQYLSLALKAGIVGILFYLSILFWGFRYAVKRIDFLLFSFVLIIAVVSLSENILDVNKGIFFYSFFFSLFILSHRGKHTELTMEKQPPNLKSRFHKNKTELTVQLETQ